MSCVKITLEFRASLWYLTSGKKFMVINTADPEILGGFHPPDAIKLSKRADAINHYFCQKSISIDKVLSENLF